MAKAKTSAAPEYDRELVIAHVLAELSAGIPLSRVLGPDREPWLCTERCFWKWYHEADPDEVAGLVQKVARARQCGVEARIERALEIAETPMMGEVHTIERIKPADMDLNDLIDDGPQDLVKTTRADMLGHRKLMVDTAFKAAQMLKPKSYGPKLDLTSAGEKIALSAELEAARKRAAD